MRRILAGPAARHLLTAGVLLATAAACGDGDPASGSGGADTAGQGGEGGERASNTTPSASSSSATSAGGDDVGAGGSGDGGATGAGGEAPTDPCPRARAEVPPGTPLNVRPDPSTTNEPVGSLRSGDVADVVAIVEGESIDGNSVWYEIDAPWVSGFVFSGFAVCTDEPATELPDGYYLPLECGTSATVSQGNDSPFSHNGYAAHAFDFALPSGVPMVAMAAGTVGYLYDQTNPGDPCYSGGDSSCINEANYVVIRHTDGTQTQYAHLSEVHVTLGQSVARGEVVGLSGSSGWSTGPHAHVQRDSDCGAPFCGSIPLSFVEVGVPVAGQSVTSMNCPD